jgi:hypothetical protein
VPVRGDKSRATFGTRTNGGQVREPT